MSVKHFFIPGVGETSIYKRKGAKTMRLSISHEGVIRLSIPRWSSFNNGIIFVKNNLGWIESHKAPAVPNFVNNVRIGKSHTIRLIKNQSVSKISTRVSQNEIKIYLPIRYEVSSPEVQKFTKTAVLRALKKEAQQILPQKVDFLAKQHGIAYNQVKIKHLKSRWGSCNNLKQITLSLYLMQLPWELIDYVILHELTHTKVLTHGKDFWIELSKYLPDAKLLKKKLNIHKPTVTTSI